MIAGLYSPKLCGGGGSGRREKRGRGRKYDGGGGEKLKMGEEGLEEERKIENWRGGLEVTSYLK